MTEKEYKDLRQDVEILANLAWDQGTDAMLSAKERVPYLENHGHLMSLLIKIDQLHAEAQKEEPLEPIQALDDVAISISEMGDSLETYAGIICQDSGCDAAYTLKGAEEFLKTTADECYRLSRYIIRDIKAQKVETE